LNVRGHGRSLGKQRKRKVEFGIKEGGRGRDEGIVSPKMKVATQIGESIKKGFSVFTLMGAMEGGTVRAEGGGEKRKGQEDSNR